MVYFTKAGCRGPTDRTATILAIRAVCPVGHEFETEDLLLDFNLYADLGSPIIEIRCPKCDDWSRAT